jgi:hypothetical protein
MVNGKEYPYTAKGIAAAKAAKGDGAGEKNRMADLKKKALKSELDKRAAGAKANRKKRKGESDSAYKARLRTYDFGNPNE